MAAHKNRIDARFPYVAELPDNVPPIDDPSSEFPSDWGGGPPHVTYYFPIKVMPGERTNATGVFFPKGFQFPGTINVILYFHGHKAGEFNTINEYWAEGGKYQGKGKVGAKHYLFLREAVNASGKQAVLVAPTMGAAPGSSLNDDMGIFRNPGAVDGYLAEVAEKIGQYVPQYAETKRRPQIGNIVLAGHSGAGGILLQQVRTMKSRVCEVWGFDSLYGWGTRNVRDGRKWKEEDIVTAEWLKSALSHQAVVGTQQVPGSSPIPIPTLRPATRFYFYWWALNSVGKRASSVRQEIDRLGLPNVKILKSEMVDPSDGWESHFGTVRVNFQRRVAEAICF